LTDSVQSRLPDRLNSGLVTFAIISLYAALMMCTNTRYTIIDDEANFIAAAAQAPMPLLHDFFTRQGMHDLHPPTVTILLHGWLLATHFSFFAIRTFANIFFIAAAYCTARAAKKLGGVPAYWWTLSIAFLWPFAFQYGRITEWYGCAMLLLSAATWAYVALLEDRGSGAWWAFAASAILLVCCSYFGFVFLFVLLGDLMVFHRKLARARWPRILAVAAAVALAFLPLLKPALANTAESSAPNAFHLSLAHDIAAAGYPTFSIFGSAAVAPWFWPLSIPVVLAVAVLIASLWSSAGRRWFLYFVLTMLVLEISGQMTIKRVVFLLPWLLLAMGVAVTVAPSRSRITARIAVGLMILCGWIGIASGRHYATTNLYEPWAKVAELVARDVHNGATVVSMNPPFFLYLDYQLGLQGEVGSSFADLGADIYRAHGYKILEAASNPSASKMLRGKVILVKGPSVEEEVQWMNQLDGSLRTRCRLLGEYRAAPDPAAALKARFVQDTAVMTFRTDVLWYDCP
jgi:hypothetical protein